MFSASCFTPGLNLSIRKGELIAVVGPVACGKTTLLMSLIKVYLTLSAAYKSLADYLNLKLVSSHQSSILSSVGLLILYSMLGN